MPDYPLNRFLEMAPLNEDEARCLRGLGNPPVRYVRKETIRHEGEHVNCVYLLLEGWVTASVLVPSGGRQTMKVHLPGDILGTPSMALEVAAETLTALTDCTVSSVPLDRMGKLFGEHPRLAALFLMAVQLERVALMDTIASMGQAEAQEQLIAFFLDLHDRLDGIGQANKNAFDLPMTQGEIAEVLGISIVHVNRTIRKLDDQGLIIRSERNIRLNNIDALREPSIRPRRKVRYNPEWAPASRSGGPAVA